MLSPLLHGFAFAALVLGALPFISVLIDYPVIPLASLAFFALTVAGYEITRRRQDKPTSRKGGRCEEAAPCSPQKMR